MDNNTESNNNEQPKELSTIEMIEKVKATEEFKTLVTNEAKNYIGSELKTVYTNFDSVVKDTLGVDKPDDVKSTEWIRQNLSKIGEYEKELNALKAKGEGNEAQEKLWNDKFSKLKKALELKESEVKAVIQKAFSQNVNSQIDTFLVGKNFNPTYSDDIVKTLVEATKGKIVNNTKQLENGKIAVWNPEEGNYYTDTLGEPLTPSQVAEKLFAPMFHTNKTGGATPTDQKKAAIQGDVLPLEKTDFATKEQAFAHFNEVWKKTKAKEGKLAHGTEFNKILKATLEHYNLNKLPLD
jgi:hypothetical protein